MQKVRKLPFSSFDADSDDDAPLAFRAGRSRVKPLAAVAPAKKRRLLVGLDDSDDSDDDSPLSFDVAHTKPIEKQRVADFEMRDAESDDDIAFNPIRKKPIGSSKSAKSAKSARAPQERTRERSTRRSAIAARQKNMIDLDENRIQEMLDDDDEVETIASAAARAKRNRDALGLSKHPRLEPCSRLVCGNRIVSSLLRSPFYLRLMRCFYAPPAEYAEDGIGGRGFEVCSERYYANAARMEM